MHRELEAWLASVRFGDVQAYRQISVFPLHREVHDTPAYIALDDAMRAKTITVTEVDKGGSVPHLLVANQSDSPVLILRKGIEEAEALGSPRQVNDLTGLHCS